MVNNNCLKEIRDKGREDQRLKEWAFFTEEMESESLSAVVFEEVIRKLRHAPETQGSDTDEYEEDEERGDQ